VAQSPAHTNGALALAQRQLAEAIRRRGLLEFRCANPECQRVIGEYEPPVRYFLVRCRRCGLYSELSTTG
jgi:hypothetical protein